MHDHHLSLPILEITPTVHESSFIADDARLISRVVVEKGASIWFKSVLRGDIQDIVIGQNSNVQDGSIIHVTNRDPCVVGANVTIGHHVNLHGCAIESGVLVGIGAIVLSGAVIKKDSIIAAGTVVKEREVLDSGFLYAGIPARKVRPLRENEIENNYLMVEKYCKLAAEYRRQFKP